jgi:hypothetical protein
MGGRFVSPADPPLVIWLLGHAAAGIATGLALTAVWHARRRHWWRPCAALGAGAFQLGVVLGWSSAMDADRALQSAPVLLCAIGALAVAVAALGLDDPEHDAAWPGPVALGGLIGFTTLAVGAAHLFALDLTNLTGGAGGGGADREAMVEMMGGMGGSGGGGMDPEALMEIMGGGGGMDPSAMMGDRFSSMSGLVRLAVVVVTITPVALGALIAARRPRQPALSSAGFLVLILLPVLAAGGVGTAIGVAVVAGAVAAVVVRVREGAVESLALPAIPAIVLAGTAVAIGVDQPLLIVGVAVYGVLLGGLLVLATHAADPEQPSFVGRVRLLLADVR